MSMNEIPPEQVLLEVSHLVKKVDEYISTNQRAHDEIWNHVDGLKKTIYGHHASPGLATEVALLKEYKENLQRIERMKGYREWGMVALLIGILIKAFFGA